METLENTQQDSFSYILVELEGLAQIENTNIQNAFNKLKDAIQTIRDTKETLMRDNNTLKIGVVGQVKAGKSSFLNSLFFDGESILPKASTPMTAGLTVLEYNDSNEFQIEYYNKKEWRIFEVRADDYDRQINELKIQEPALASLPDENIAKMFNVDSELCAAKNLVSKCGDIAKGEIEDKAKTVSRPFSSVADLQSMLENYVGASGRYTPIVKCLTIKLCDERLKGIQIVDTPGVNDPVLSREQRTREFLRACHGVFFLSYASRFFDSTDADFLASRIGSEGIGTVVLIASKFDSVLQDVGMQFRARLGAAIRDCREKLQKQFLNNLRNIDYTGQEPVFDVSSGIGFSIFKKDERRWDSMEKHVVERMKTYYPNNFSTPEKIKETFFALSNIDDIRDKYLDGVFVSNKDEIIRQKTSDYMSSVTGQFKADLKKQIDSLYISRNSLEGSAVKDLETKKYALEKIIDRIQTNMNSIVNRYDSRSEMYFKEILNSVHLDWSGPLPQTTIRKNFSRGSTFWNSDKSESIEYSIVDCNKAAEDLRRTIKTYYENLSRSWNDKFRQSLSDLTQAMNEIVDEAENNDQTNKIDADKLRNIILETNDSLLNQSTLNFSQDILKHQNTIIEVLTGADEIKIGRTCQTEEELRNKVKALAKNKNNEVILTINSTMSTIMKDDENTLRKARARWIEILQNNKNQIVDNVRQKTADSIETLKKELENKQQELDNYSAAIEVLTNISKQL